MNDFNYETYRRYSCECSDKDSAETTYGDRYLKVWDFMIFDFNLAKTELLIYAQIFAIYKNKCYLAFSGSREYLAKWAHASIRTVSDALKSLEQKGLIVKVYDASDKNRRRPLYWINIESLPISRAFSRENYYADQIRKERKELEARGESFDIVKIYQEVHRPWTHEDTLRLVRDMRHNKEQMLEEKKMLDEYYLTKIKPPERK